MGQRTGRHTPYYDPESALTTLELVFIQNLAAEAIYDSTVIPIVETGSGAPVSTPSAVGSIYVDITGDHIYMATGTSSSADWIQVDGGGGGGFTELTATGSANGTNVTFTFTQLPSYIVADGVWYKPTSKDGLTVFWSNVGLTVTMVNPPAYDIFGVA